MNRVLFRAEDLPMPPWKKAAGTYVRRVLDTLGLKNWELSVLFCSNSYIKTLNNQYRKKDEATDVLSFPLGANEEPDLAASTDTDASSKARYLAGDIVISLDALEENSRFFKVSADEELRRLLVHGILHLNGYDHETNNTGEPMLRAQEEILAQLREKVI